MRNLLHHKGYSASVEYDDDSACFIGRVLGMREPLLFRATSVQGLRGAFTEAIEAYLQRCALEGKKPDRTYSGTIFLRVRPELHARMMLAAKASGRSLNRWAGEVLEKACSRK